MIQHLIEKMADQVCHSATSSICLMMFPQNSRIIENDSRSVIFEKEFDFTIVHLHYRLIGTLRILHGSI